MYKNFGFSVICNDGRARCGEIVTPHGVVKTPAFIFCGTKATVKGIWPAQLTETGTQIILSNTYHLFLNPGGEAIKKMGGLHKITGWNGPMLTDSGGFQIFSFGYGSVADEIKGKRQGKSSMVSINDAGAKFRSYWDGSYKILTPEISIQTQKDLGADLIVVLDECTPFHSSRKYTERSLKRSHAWELRSLKKFKEIDDETQALYGIIQGGVHPDLRKISAEFVSENDFFGTAIGGTLGQTKEQMHEVVDMAFQGLDTSRPIHLLGIGGITDIFNGVALGIDTFDCVHPTRVARHGGALVHPEFRDAINKEHINLKNSKYEFDNDPIENGCQCECCRNFSKAYLHYLLKAQEMLAVQAISVHNIYFMNKLMEEIRQSIRSGTFLKLREQWCRNSL